MEEERGGQKRKDRRAEEERSRGGEDEGEDDRMGMKMRRMRDGSLAAICAYHLSSPPGQPHAAALR